MFLGTFSPRLDDKNRLILPAKFRPAFESGIVMTRGQERCVFAFPRAEFERLVSDVTSAPLTNRDARDYSRMLLSGAQDEVPDKQGRVVVSPLLRTYAGLERDLAVLGVGNRVEIWDAAAWERRQGEGEQSFADRDTEIVPGLLCAPPCACTGSARRGLWPPAPSWRTFPGARLVTGGRGPGRADRSPRARGEAEPLARRPGAAGRQPAAGRSSAPPRPSSPGSRRSPCRSPPRRPARAPVRPGTSRSCSNAAWSCSRRR